MSRLILGSKIAMGYRVFYGCLFPELLRASDASRQPANSRLSVDPKRKKDAPHTGEYVCNDFFFEKGLKRS